MPFRPGDRVRLRATENPAWNNVYAGKEATVRLVGDEGVMLGPARGSGDLLWPAPHGFFWFREVELVARDANGTP